MDYYIYIIAFLVIALIYLLLRQRKVENNIEEKFEESHKKIDELYQNMEQGVENAVLRTFQTSSSVFENVFISAMSRNTEVIKGAFTTSLKELGIHDDASNLKETSNDLKKLTTDLKSMFEIKQSRAKFGELQLENLLKDMFPSQRLHFQKNIPETGTPDACIQVESDKNLCIDSKFPLENLKNFGKAEKEEERERFWNRFLKDVEKHIDDVGRKYVGKKTTMDFAFMYVPSDTIYYQLVSEAPHVVVNASKKGVILSSPSVLPAYLNLISAGIRAEEISERAEEIQKKIDGLDKYMGELEESLGKTNKHLGNAHTSMGKTMQSFNSMRSYFSSISGLEEVENENNGL